MIVALSLLLAAAPPTELWVDEETIGTVEVRIPGARNDQIRFYGLPTGARWDSSRGTLSFRPDFIQGPARWTVRAAARLATRTATHAVVIHVRDTIRPPWPTVIERHVQPDRILLTVQQKSDRFLDSDGYRSRSYLARIVVPANASAEHPRPVRVFLHGFGGAPFVGGAGDQFRIYPHDPRRTYWWGYGDELPRFSPKHGRVIDFTRRRVLHLVEWVQKHFVGADANRTYITGGSMGGAGATTYGLLSARHFCFARAMIGQTIPRNHRPERLEQLSRLWGLPSQEIRGTQAHNAWDEMDLTRVLLDEPSARDQFIFTKHGKDDTLIHFGAVVQRSPRTKRSFYEALRDTRTGHYAVWDEGGHGTEDPTLGYGWWDAGWDPVLDPVTFLRSDRAFVAFSFASSDEAPGHVIDPASMDSSRGYAGDEAVPGDTRWPGATAGARNRFLRWDSRTIIDTEDRFEIDLFHTDAIGGPPPGPGYPSTGDAYYGSRPIRADVTPRRLQRFVLLPGDRVEARYRGRTHRVVVDGDGAVTLPGLEIHPRPARLRLRLATKTHAP